MGLIDRVRRLMLKHETTVFKSYSEAYVWVIRNSAGDCSVVWRSHINNFQVTRTTFYHNGGRFCKMLSTTIHS
jgi:endonuclease/exonuclease/phosphatase (EEP) superfamily protein YafD